jgi:hypothetical protein
MESSGARERGSCERRVRLLLLPLPGDQIAAAGIVASLKASSEAVTEVSATVPFR